MELLEWKYWLSCYAAPHSAQTLHDVSPSIASLTEPGDSTEVVDRAL